MKNQPREASPPGTRERQTGLSVLDLFQDGAKAMLLVFLAMAILIFALHQLLAVLHRYPLDYGEAPLVDQAMRLAAGGSTGEVAQAPRNIYRADLSTPPYTISNYPPLYVLALAPFIAIFGPNFWAGRLISIISALAAGLFLARMVREQSRSRFAGMVAAGVFWTMPYVVHWSSLLRIDLLALALSMAALYLFVRRPEAPSTLIGGGLLLVAAIYTRQSYALAAPLAAFVWLWLRVGWRRALILAALVAGVGLTLFLVLNILTGGGFFFNVVTANVNEFGWNRLTDNLETLARDAPFLLLLGAVSLGAMPALGITGRRGHPHWPLVVPYLVGAFLSSLTIGKIGSNVNYFLELCAALSLAAGTWIAWAGTVAERRWRGWLQVALILLLTLQAGWLMRTTLGEYVPRLRERRGATALLEDLEWEVAHTGGPGEGPVIGDEYMGLVTLQGWPLYIQPFEMTQLAEAGLWDQTNFVEEIRDGTFDMILIHYFPGYDVYKERWTPDMLSAVQHAYAADRMYADTRLYRPRAGSSAPVERCPDAPWRVPTSGHLGIQWDEGRFDFFGWGNEDGVPVYAVADGLLMRREEWNDRVAIQHDDPLRPGEKIWSYYTHLAGANGMASYVSEEFPPGSASVPVQAGQLLGHQGRWSGQPSRPMWVHLQFAVVRAGEAGSFPEEMGVEDTLDPSPYLGLALDENRYGEWQALRCEGQQTSIKGE